MMDYTQFTVEDFVLDGDFRRWILAPNAESNTFWQSWLEKNPDKVTVLQEARVIILSIPRIDYGWREGVEDQLWQRIFDETKTQLLNGAEDTPDQSRAIPLHPEAVLGRVSDRYSRRVWHRTVAWRIAASFLLVLTAVVFSYFLAFHLPPEDVASARLLVADAPAGAKLNFTLSDGTRVFLHGNSRIIYPEAFPSHERRIEIEGEAFLEVAKDTERPFLVKTGTVITEALGTAFNVRNDAAAVEIALVEGAVKVTSAQKGLSDRSVILAPGSCASRTENGELLTIPFDIDEVTAWTKNVLYFKGAAEQEVLRRLEQWYGVEIITRGVPSQAWNYSGKFHSKSLDFVLMSMGYTMGFSFEVRGKKVILQY